MPRHDEESSVSSASSFSSNTSSSPSRRHRKRHRSDRRSRDSVSRERLRKRSSSRRIDYVSKDDVSVALTASAKAHGKDDRGACASSDDSTDDPKKIRKHKKSSRDKKRKRCSRKDTKRKKRRKHRNRDVESNEVRSQNKMESARKIMETGQQRGTQESSGENSKEYKKLIDAPEKSSDSPVADIGKEARRARMAPMSKEQYEKEQKVIREVYDEESGRWRLVRGSGEIIERIVSRDDHQRINQRATRGDGSCYSKHVYGLLQRR